MKDSNSFINNPLSLAPISLGLLAFLGVLFFTPKYSIDAQIKREIETLVQQNYVDHKTLPKKPEKENFDDWLKALDPHTRYLPPAQALQSKNELRGILVGIGIYIVFNDQKAMVTYVNPKSPAAENGIIPGDLITTINGISIAKILLSDSSIRQRIIGEEGTVVQMGFYNPHFKQKKQKNIVRSSLRNSSTESIFMVNKTIGYAKFSIFSTNAHQELKDSLKSLAKKGMKHLVLDLRNNGGGILTEAVAIANEFLAKDQIITATKGRKRPTAVFKAKGNGRFMQMPLVVLINQYSASASEVLSAALKENKRATIIGNRTYGKALVQEPYGLSNKGELTLTVAKYYTPTGKLIQRNYPYQYADTNFGVSPDYSVAYAIVLDPSFEDYMAASQMLYLKNWKAIYPNVQHFADFIKSKPNFSQYLALGLMVYGPNEFENLVLNKDPVFAKAVEVFRE